MYHEDFIPQLQAFWSNTTVPGTAMFQLSKKLKLLKPVIKDINREHFSGLEQRVQESHAHMLSAQADLLSSPLISAAAREREAHRNWTKLAKAEEKFIYQRSRVTWAKFGDCNSSLFHRSMQARRSGNQIHYLIDDQNLRLENINDIKSHCVEYYTSLLGAPSPSLSPEAMEEISPRHLIGCNIGNGRNASYWFDDWLPSGPLIDSVGEAGPCRLGIPITATVSEGVRRGVWITPSPRCRTPSLASLRATLLEIDPPTNEDSADSYCWGPSGHRAPVFSITKTWESIRLPAPQVYWEKAVWFKHAVNKHAFHFWVANLNRLPVRERLVTWGCEIRDHVFLRCSVATQLWDIVLARLGQQALCLETWPSLINWMLTVTPGLSATLKKLTAQLVVFHLWRERNNRLHQGPHDSTSTLFSKVDRAIRDILLARLPHKRCQGLLSQWFRFT
ncbi:hypothetical protein Bca52824_064963 [Brassica carinata]|uniref:Reverse transcriptase zinc-binding domain-containing protein n=1 Tax=Brassica carinata TaxID=52824 RepID=A0A8X7QMF9_BRACI|nr:hypothetical protein Bca52824_064963 [Brassica carinata]